jgi:exosortase
VSLLDSVGMAIARQGNIIHLAGTSLEVAEACSGLRSLVSLLALGALFAYLTQRRFAGQAILFLATIPIAVAANVFRVFSTAVLVSLVSVEVTAEPLHTIMGMSVFVFSFVCLAILGFILGKIFR